MKRHRLQSENGGQKRGPIFSLEGITSRSLAITRIRNKRQDESSIQDGVEEKRKRRRGKGLRGNESNNLTGEMRRAKCRPTTISPFLSATFSVISARKHPFLSQKRKSRRKNSYSFSSSFSVPQRGFLLQKFLSPIPLNKKKKYLIQNARSRI